MNTDERDRLTKLEVNVEHLTRQVDEMKDTVTELRDLLLQARGARWMIGILIAVGGFMSGMLAKYLPFLPR